MKSNMNTNMKTIVKTNKKNNETDFFFPTQKDSLFWCLYIITNGISKYEEIPNFNVVVEKKEKIDYIIHIPSAIYDSRPRSDTNIGKIGRAHV